MKQKEVFKKAGRLFFLLFLTNLVGYVGSTFITPAGVAWYDTLVVSSLNPPAVWFGIVWTGLYAAMAIAGWLVWNRVSPRPFVIQLAFNLIWPFLFFYMKSPVWALADIGLMLFFLGRTVRAFYPVSRPAGWLMVLPLIWSLFAAYLNLIVVLYNTQIGIWMGLI